jgi:hypothetical protein
MHTTAFYHSFTENESELGEIFTRNISRKIEVIDRQLGSYAVDL